MTRTSSWAIGLHMVWRLANSADRPRLGALFRPMSQSAAFEAGLITRCALGLAATLKSTLEERFKDSIGDVIQTNEGVGKEEALASAASRGLGRLDFLNQVPATKPLARTHSAFGSFVPTNRLATLPVDLAHEDRIRLGAILDSLQLISGPRVVDIFLRMLVFVCV